jgi:ribonuclease D
MGNSNYLENITAEEITSYELSWFGGEIVIVDNLEMFYKVLPEVAASKILGFDTETKPSFRKGIKNRVALLQLASDEKAWLFRINKTGIPRELAALLSDENIIKAGVAIHDDLRFLRNIRKFEPAGFIDLQSYVKDFGIQSSGLKKLAAIVLGIRISKRQQVSDWESDLLSDAQKVYAATDAWVCHQIYKKLSCSTQK